MALSLFTSQPLVLQTAFSELKRQAREQAVLLLGSPGTVVTREVKGSRFLYRDHYAPGGKKAADYLGPADEEGALARADDVREQIAVAKALLHDARLLAQHGYVRVDGRTDAVLAALANNGLFRAGAVLIGSHAYGVLLNELGVSASTVHTEDIDVARDRALRFDAEAKPFEQMLQDSKIPVFAIPPLDRKAPSTSFSTRGRDKRDKLRVDLLVPTDGSAIKTLEVRDLGAHATALPWLRYLLQTPVPTVVIGRASMVPVNVPRAERLAWHKMLVSELRHETSEKRAKDIEQAAVLAAVLAQQAPESLEEAYRDVPSAAKVKTKRGARRVLARLEETGQEQAVAVMRDLLGST